MAKGRKRVIKIKGFTWLVKNDESGSVHRVENHDCKWVCDCEGFKFRGDCSHIEAVIEALDWQEYRACGLPKGLAKSFSTMIAANHLFQGVQLKRNYRKGRWDVIYRKSKRKEVAV